MIKCKICFKEFFDLTWHLRSHKISVADYRSKYNTWAMMSEEKKKQISECTKEAMWDPRIRKKYLEGNKNKNQPPPWNKQPERIIECAICGKEFVINNRRYNQKCKRVKNPEFVCSKECSSKLQSKNIGKVRGTEKSRNKTRDQMIKRWESVEWRAHFSEVMKSKPRSWHENRLKASWAGRKPTSIEKKVQYIIEKYNLPYRYTGNGEFWIGGHNPDFVNINGEKTLIEVNGCFFHKCPVCNLANAIDVTGDRFNVYEKYGWKSIVIWGHELKRDGWQEKVLLKIRGEL